MTGETPKAYSDEDVATAKLLNTTPYPRTVRALDMELRRQALAFTKLHLVQGAVHARNLVQIVMTEEQALHLASFVSAAGKKSTMSGKPSLNLEVTEEQTEWIRIGLQCYRDTCQVPASFGSREFLEKVSQINRVIEWFDEEVQNAELWRKDEDRG